MADGDYEPTWGSLDAHACPGWYDDAKLGIWLHWGVYSVPAWAPPEDGDHSLPYAEWYPRYMYEEGTPIREYHCEHYGDADYADFIPEWSAANWDPGEWAALFDGVGARYVALTAEHHDGFPLWDSAHTDRTAATEGPNRDLVADLGTAVREHGLRYAPTFHGLLNYYDPRYPDEAFGNPHYDPDGPDPEYVEYMNAKLRELIEEHRPDLLWLDGDWMADAETFRTKETLAHYYNSAREWGVEVAANDRLGQCRWKDEGESHGDFYTPEYESYDGDGTHKWEACRGIGRSFGYNRTEGPENYLPVADLVRSFVDIVSRNGNLLLNLGPRADGTIPDLQRERLLGLGEWLDVNGEAIFGSSPWAMHADGAGGVEVRYTRRDGALYATFFGWPTGRTALAVPDRADAGDARATLLGADADPTARVAGDGLSLDFPARERAADLDHAFVVRLDGLPLERA